MNRRHHGGWILLDNALGLVLLGTVLSLLLVGMGQTNRLRHCLADQRAGQREVERHLSDATLGDSSALLRLRDAGYTWRALKNQPQSQERVWIAVSVPGLGDARELLAHVPRATLPQEVQP